MCVDILSDFCCCNLPAFTSDIKMSGGGLNDALVYMTIEKLHENFHPKAIFKSANFLI